jgi:hypothetical protein
MRLCFQSVFCGAGAEDVVVAFRLLGVGSGRGWHSTPASSKAWLSQPCQSPPGIVIVFHNIILANQQISGITIHVSNTDSISFAPIARVTFSIGTMTLDRGVSFVSTSKPQLLLSGHIPQARNSSTASWLPMIVIESTKAATSVSFGLHSNRSSFR